MIKSYFFSFATWFGLSFVVGYAVPVLVDRGDYFLIVTLVGYYLVCLVLSYTIDTWYD